MPKASPNTPVTSKLWLTIVRDSRVQQFYQERNSSRRAQLISLQTVSSQVPRPSPRHIICTREFRKTVNTVLSSRLQVKICLSASRVLQSRNQMMKTSTPQMPSKVSGQISFQALMPLQRKKREAGSLQ
jgi:hypothetical protein